MENVTFADGINRYFKGRTWFVPHVHSFHRNSYLICAIFVNLGFYLLQTLFPALDQLIHMSNSDWLQVTNWALSRPRLYVTAIGCARAGGNFPSIWEEVAGLRGDDDAGDSSQRSSHHVSLRKLAALPTVWWLMKIFECNIFFHPKTELSKLNFNLHLLICSLRYHNAGHNASSTNIWNTWNTHLFVVVFFPPVPKLQDYLLMFFFFQK